MPIETMDLLQKAVYCAKAGVDRFNHVVRSAPVQVYVRWEWQFTELVMDDGTKVKTDAWLAVDREMRSGDTIWLGDILDWVGTGSALGEETNEICEVVFYEEIPDVDNVEIRREVRVRKYLGSPPELG